MTDQELMELVGQDIEFGKDAELLAEVYDYIEPGMRARVVAADAGGDVLILKVDFEPHEDHNRPLEQADIRDGAGSSVTRTARELGRYEPVQEFEMDWDMAPRYFQTIESPAPAKGL